MLDKTLQTMVKYFGIGYRVERKEYLFRTIRESGSSAESPGREGNGKVRPGAKLF